MRLLPLWLRRADPGASALVLPARALSYGELAALPGRPGLNALAGDATTLALGLAQSGLGGGTAFPLAASLDAATCARLCALAEAEARPGLALVIATSGSEGTPKGVKLPWRAVAAAARISRTAAPLAPGDVWLACLPLHHIGGAMILYRCWRAGATALVHDGFDAAAVARDLHARKVTHISLVPPMLSRLIEAGVTPPITLRHALVGGAALSAALFARALAHGWPVCPTYGMTETCSQVTLWPRPGAADWREGDAGAPLPGVGIEVLTPNADGIGRLRIATPARMAGYLGAPPAGPWLETRDLGRIDSAGGLHIAGRADDVLVSAGINVHPLEVENRLAACPGVVEAGVTGIADAVWGDIIAALYAGEASEAAVETWCRERLPAQLRPRRFLRVERLPRTSAGKLDRRGLATLAGRAA